MLVRSGFMANSKLSSELFASNIRRVMIEQSKLEKNESTELQEKLKEADGEIVAAFRKEVDDLVGLCETNFLPAETDSIIKFFQETALGQKILSENFAQESKVIFKRHVDAIAKAIDGKAKEFRASKASRREKAAKEWR